MAGEEGIRTLDTVSRIVVLETAAISHSATPGRSLFEKASLRELQDHCRAAATGDGWRGARELLRFITRNKINSTITTSTTALDCFFFLLVRRRGTGSSSLTVTVVRIRFAIR